MLNLHIFGLVLFSLMGCLQDINSSSSDRDTYSPVVIDTSTPGGQRFSDAYDVLKKNCISCHASTMNLTTEEQWLESGYIVQGSPLSSSLYCRIHDSGCGAEDMPKDGTIADADREKIKTWIENL